MKCKFCGRVINNKGSLIAHQNNCILNPNKTERTRSPNAGAQKGSVPWNKGRSVGRPSHWDDKYPLEDVLIENSSYPRKSIKKRILANDLIEYKCECCGIGPHWNGKPMILILDHINGINNDNRLENLRFVCSNCDSQLPTYKSRNRINGEVRKRSEPGCLENS